MLNHIVIMGRLTRNPELRRTQSGKPVCTITLAVDRDRQPKDSEKLTDFIDVVAWDKLAEFVAKYLAKGRMVVAEGRLISRKWEDESKSKHTSWEVHASSLYFTDSRRSEQANDNAEPSSNAGIEEGEEAS